MPVSSRSFQPRRLLLLWSIVAFAVANSETRAASTVHPIVPGHSRIYSSTEADAVQAGRLLLAELNCVSCHKADVVAPPDGQTEQLLKPKQAPILDAVGGRVQVEWLQKFLASTHGAKPGTTMPNLFAGLREADRNQKVTALTHFLAQSGSVADAMGDTGAVRRGEQLFHTIGCVACHGPMKGNSDDGSSDSMPTSVPLGSLTEKYSLPSLHAFLKNPLAVRPGGRMPDLRLDDKQSRDLACFFFKDVKLSARVNFAYYEGGWQKLPDFSSLEPKTEGQASSFDISVRQRNDGFGLRFSGFIHIPKDGEYRFLLGSDDGSRLSVAGETIIDNDNVHPHSVKDGRKKLAQGVYPVQVDYFEAGGHESLSVEIEGAGLPRQSLASITTMTEQKPEPEPGKEEFILDKGLAKQGQELFASAGCASCHQMKFSGKPIASKLQARGLIDLAELNEGCLSDAPKPGLPHYQLSELQRSHLVAAIESAKSGSGHVSEQAIHRTMAQFNCFACHDRDKQGGVEEVRNEFFTSTMKEMGDEGRIPPSLNGVGDKLTEEWMKNILGNGSKDRPYMLTMMPKFGASNVSHLTAAFRDADLKTEAKIAEYSLPDPKMKAAGRKLAGDKALSCIKCHTFNGSKALGIQSIDLSIMSKRLREDWFHRYMENPQIYRPGTRMPAPWPSGIALIEDVLDAHAGQQMHAVWLYLTDGPKAGPPPGLIKGAIVLKAETQPRIYRNFIEGVSPRGIAVGYPEGVNLCFDADTLSLALIWENEFIDASRHWNGRGQGNQPPLGDNVYRLVRGVPFAVLENESSDWPTAAPAEQGYRFRGYRFNMSRQPIFLYSKDRIAISDATIPVKSDGEFATFERTLVLESPSPIDQTIWYRAAVGSKIEKMQGGFMVDDHLRLSFEGANAAGTVIRQSGGTTELLVPVRFSDGTAQLVQRYGW